MNIKILGPGCSKCHTLSRMARETVEELGIDANVEEVKDVNKIIEYSILKTPGLVIDEEVVCSGRLPTKTEVRQFITTTLEKEERYKK